MPTKLIYKNATKTTAKAVIYPTATLSELAAPVVPVCAAAAAVPSVIVAVGVAVAALEDTADDDDDEDAAVLVLLMALVVALALALLSSFSPFAIPTTHFLTSSLCCTK